MEYRKLEDGILVCSDGSVYKEANKSLRGSKKSPYWHIAYKKKKLDIHRLIAMVFVKNENPERYKFVCHKDDNTLNNSADNLYWGSPMVNMVDASMKGRFNGSRYLNMARMLEMGCSHKEIAEIIGVSASRISQMINNINELNGLQKTPKAKLKTSR